MKCDFAAALSLPRMWGGCRQHSYPCSSAAPFCYRGVRSPNFTEEPRLGEQAGLGLGEDAAGAVTHLRISGEAHSENGPSTSRVERR